MTQRVVITGVGLVTPVGLTADVVMDALLAGRSGIAPISSFDTEHVSSRVAGEIPGFVGKEWIHPRKTLKMMTPAVQYGMAAVKMAIDSSRLDTEAVPTERLGVAIGTGSGGGELDLVAPAIEASRTDEGAFDIVKFGEEGMHQINPLWLIRGLSNAVMGHASTAWKMRGYNTNICNSGASGLQAIGDAARAIAHGRADVMVAGGYDAVVSPQYLVRFERLGLLTQRTEPERASRPFDAGRDGFVAADGAGFVILETLDAAKARGATIYAEVSGYGNASDGTSFLDPLEDGAGIARAMQHALEDAAIRTDDVQAVFAHAPGTQPYDRAETQAIRSVFRAHADELAVPAIKSSLGHCIAAAGSVTAAVAACAMKQGRVPPTLNRWNPDPGCDLDYVTEGARDLSVHQAVVNASGLGGFHTSVVLSAAD